MNKKSRHIEELTPEVIQAYHSGKLTSKEMHQVELLMLENPFYEDGLEGLQILESTILEADLRELSEKIDKSTKKERTGFWTFYTRTAAAILLLMSFATLFYFSKQQSQLPTKNLSELDEEKDKLYSNSTSKTLSTDSIEAEVSNSQIKEYNIIEEQNPELEEIETRIEPKPVTPPNANNITKLQPIPQRVNPLVKDSNENNNYTIDQSIKQETRKIELPKAMSLQLKLKQEGLVSKDQQDDKSVGIKTDTILTTLNRMSASTIDSSKGKKIWLRGHFKPIIDSATLLKEGGFSESNNAGEALVGKVRGVRVSPEKNEISTYTSTKPEIGYPKFNRYLRKNLKYPEAAREKKIRGRVTVQFRVSETGTLSNFQIINGLGYGCDEEAIRLIKEGPKWLPKTEGPLKRSVSSTVRIKVRFKP